MPFPDSQYPSVLRGYDKRQSERLAAAAPDLLAALKEIVDYDEGSNDPGDFGWAVLQRCKDAIAKAEGQ